MMYKVLSKASIMLAFSIILFANSKLLAAPKVVDSVSLAQQAQVKSERQASKDQAKANSQLFYQLQILQDEMMRMRGQMEEQAHQIRLLKQQRLDDYIAFDKRLADLNKQPEIKVSALNNAANGALGNNALKPQPDAGDEQTDYKAAFSLVREKKNEQAKVAFKNFIKNHPDSALLPNCYFWLGRLQAQSSEFKDADASFTQILENFPNDKRVPETLFHKAKVQFELGNKSITKSELDNIIARYSNNTDAGLQRTVRQAREFLNTHYP